MNLPRSSEQTRRRNGPGRRNASRRRPHSPWRSLASRRRNFRACRSATLAAEQTVSVATSQYPTVGAKSDVPGPALGRGPQVRVNLHRVDAAGPAWHRWTCRPNLGCPPRSLISLHGKRVRHRPRFRGCSGRAGTCPRRRSSFFQTDRFPCGVDRQRPEANVAAAEASDGDLATDTASDFVVLRPSES